MIAEIVHEDKKFRLINEKDLIKDRNIYSIIVGKNGSGKSHLLNNIIHSVFQNFYVNKHQDSLFNNNILLKKSSLYPKNILAISTSPFDKFPLSNEYKNTLLESNYHYLGIRDIKSRNFGLALLNKIILNILDVANSNPIQLENLKKTLKYIGYMPVLNLIYRTKLNRQNIEIILNELQEIKSNKEKIQYYLFKSKIGTLLSTDFFKIPGQLNEFDIEKFNKLYDILSNIELIDDIQVIINDGVRISNHFYFEIRDLLYSELLFLIECGLLKLKEVLLYKENHDIYDLTKASSGEQCILITILNIAALIKNNSLILIDEPEISLHPEWQEKFIQLLISTFKNFKNCHFIIATHSPQLISKLEHDNCFILKINENILLSASKSRNQSIDYQLANIFDSPGFKNEYLARIGFSILSKVSKVKMFDEEDLGNYQILINQQPNLDLNDPLNKLIPLIQELYTKYA
ncbi:AAA family ATPase [Aureivirga marina]|uniref:AAA family ATPase n=1 Tax=Aureivirga marina TaxID=1182451 RepID=UPI0018CA0A88|nr:AAA family ATPase [Aureivirga marina]